MQRSAYFIPDNRRPKERGYIIRPRAKKRKERKKVNLEEVKTRMMPIIEAACELYSIPMGVFFSKNRARDVADARRIVSYISWVHLREFKYVIGKILGRDHTSIIHQIETTEDLVHVDPVFAANFYSVVKKFIP